MSAVRAHPDPTQRPIWPGTIGPATTTPELAPDAVRRTTAIDMSFPDSTTMLVIQGSGRDIRGGRVLDTARLDVVVDMTTEPIIREASEPTLVGLSAMRGYRRSLGEALPDVAGSGSLLALLLDEVPTAVLIAPSGLVRTDRVLREGRRAGGPPIDTCAGWIAGGEMDRAVAGPQPYFGEGPPAPSLDGWHELDELHPSEMRRARRLDVRAGEVDVLFRDSLIESDGTETVVHEYGITASVDVERRVLTEIEATPHVLPGPDCPNAAASARDLVGMRLDDVREHVRVTFTGTRTCTHLNDALRSLGDLWRFIR